MPEKIDLVMKQTKKQSKYNDVWTTKELSQILGFSRQYIWELIGKGKIATLPREELSLIHI